ncbi:MAG TPA: cytochrome c-type biogenesis protein CcmH [bacterium]
MMRIPALLVLAIVYLGLTAAPHAHAGDRGLASAFMCQCGCGLTLASCTHASCGPRDQVLGEIAAMERQGRSPEQITAALVATYGEVILGAPTRRGFNLLAWWGPYGAIAAGAALILGLGLSWVRRPRPVVPAAESDLSPEQRNRLERELRAFQD